MKPTRKMRLLVAVIAGLFAAVILRSLHSDSYSHAGDFTWVLIAARQWLHGINPYTAPINPALYPTPNPSPLFYPFTSILAALPFSFLPDMTAAAAWVFLTVGLMTYAITQDGWWRLPILLSAPLIECIGQVQWAPLLVCIWMYPTLLLLATLKPTLGIALATKKITKEGIIGVLAALLVSLILFPSWPLYWLNATTQTNIHVIPILFLPGPLLLLALLKWKNPEARLFIAMACLPQVMFFYEQLPLMLVAKNLRRQLILAIVSWMPYFFTRYIGTSEYWPKLLPYKDVLMPTGWIIVFIYGCALVFVLTPINHTVTQESRDVSSVALP
jgi:hypothetical protein